jgi:hypothetical protein
MNHDTINWAIDPPLPAVNGNTHVKALEASLKICIGLDFSCIALVTHRKAAPPQYREKAETKR